MRRLLALALAACGADEGLVHPDQERAVHVAWVDVLGVYDRPAPSLSWVTTPCPLGNATSLVFGSIEDDTLLCLEGHFTTADNHIALAWHDALHDTALPHELVHAYLLLRFHNGDGGHVREEWKTLPRAIADALRAEGL